MGFGACLFWTGCDVFLSTTSIMHLCAIAIHRFLGISYPLRFRSQQGKCHVLALLLPTWSVSFAISVPLVIQGLTHTQHVLMIDEHGLFQCGIFDQVFAIYSSLVSFFIPLVIMIIADIRSVQVLRKSSAVSATAQAYGNDNGLRRSKSCKSTMCSSVDTNCSYSMLSSRQVNKSRSLWSGDNNFPLSVGDTSPTSHTNLHLKDNCCSPDSSITHKSHTEMSSCTTSDALFNREPRSPLLNQHYDVMSRQTSHTRLNDEPAPRKTLLSTFRYNIESSVLDTEVRKKKIGYMGMLATRGLRKLNGRERRAERTLIWVFICFVVLWLPFFCTNLTYGLCKNCSISPRLFLVFTWLGYISSGVNPCIYTLLNKDFRSAFTSILLFRVYRRHGLIRQKTRQRFNME